MSSSSQITSSAAFAHWAQSRLALQHRGLSDTSLQLYERVWESWCEFLADQGLGWADGKSADVHRFLATLPALRADRVRSSPVTQSRYARILREIYARAMAEQWVSRNPVDRQARTSPSEAHDSLVFNPADWAVLVANVPTAGTRWQEVRDVCVLQLLLHAGLTVGELRALSLGDVLHSSLRWQQGLPLWSPPLLQDPDSQPRLAIEGDRPAQARTLQLPLAAGQALQEWLRLRLALPFGAGAKAALLVSQKGGAALSGKSLFLLANEFICSALAARYSPSELAHAGPMQLRNSCIVRWLDAGLSEPQVLGMAGLQDANSLRRLRRHVSGMGTGGSLAAGHLVRSTV